MNVNWDLRLSGYGEPAAEEMSENKERMMQTQENSGSEVKVALAKEMILVLSDLHGEVGRSICSLQGGAPIESSEHRTQPGLEGWCFCALVAARKAAP